MYADSENYLSRCPSKGTNWHVRPSKTWISLCICAARVLDGRHMGSQGSKVSSGEKLRKIRPRGYKNFMLNSAEHEIYPAHKC